MVSSRTDDTLFLELGLILYRYVDEDTANCTGLVKFGDDGSVIIGVDSAHTYDASQPYYLINRVGRPSVRITSTQKYNHGLFIADIAHMPGGVCGTWPGVSRSPPYSLAIL